MIKTIFLSLLGFCIFVSQPVLAKKIRPRYVRCEGSKGYAEAVVKGKLMTFHVETSKWNVHDSVDASDDEAPGYPQVDVSSMILHPKGTSWTFMAATFRHAHGPVLPARHDKFFYLGVDQEGSPDSASLEELWLVDASGRDQQVYLGKDTVCTLK